MPSIATRSRTPARCSIAAILAATVASRTVVTPSCRRWYRSGRSAGVPDRLDVVIVGGGIVGLATARAIVRARPGVRARDPREGVAHRAPPDRTELGRPALRHLLPARIAEGGDVRRRAVSRWSSSAPSTMCRSNGAARSSSRWTSASSRASTNSKRERRRTASAAERVGPERLRELEPHAAGIAALHVPDTGHRRLPTGRAGARPTRSSAAGADIRLGHQRDRGRRTRRGDHGRDRPGRRSRPACS